MSDDDKPKGLGTFNVPPYVYLLVVVLGGGGTLSAASILGQTDVASKEDIIRVEEKMDSVESKVDELSRLVTDLRIAIARFHAKDLEK